MPQATKQNRVQLSDVLTKIIGNHTLKIGAEYQHVNSSLNLGVFRQGRIEFVQDYANFDLNGDGQINDNDLLFESYKNIGCVYLIEKEIDLAEEYFHKAYVIKPNDDTLLVNLGVLEYLRKDLSKSLLYLREAISNNQKNDKAWVGLAMAHLEFGDKDLSWSNLVKAVDVEPTNKTALILMNEMAESDSQLKACQDALVKYMERDNFDEQMSHLLIHVFIKRNDFHRAQLESLKTYLWNPESSKNQELYNKITQFIQVKERGATHDSVLVK